MLCAELWDVTNYPSRMLLGFWILQSLQEEKAQSSPSDLQTTEMPVAWLLWAQGHENWEGPLEAHSLQLQASLCNGSKPLISHMSQQPIPATTGVSVLS